MRELGKNGFGKLLASIFLTLGTGLLAGFLTSTQTQWYQGLVKPFFQPPGWLFGPVWTVLYVLMGVSLYMVWKEGFKGNRNAILVFLIQLLLNFTWSIVFFSMQNLVLAFVNILALIAAITFTYREFRKVSRRAGQLLLPYLAWVSFATLLNLTLLLLN
ncbi:MAG: tryptophan-rich sensory protein [Candidatus Nanohaloarchaeota archaeon QJJ-9]|nr:tryptophan-rich sensory protein [Candidatus Nanohaloarchaeota archaeon QJJ-9]